MRKTILRIVLIILLGLTFYTIFQLSGEDATESGSRSGSLMRQIIDIFPGTKNLTNEEKEKIVEDAQPIIRKIAHFSIYTVVGLLTMSLVSTYQINQKKRIGITIGIGALYAMSDEFHQYFVPGRSAELRDVLIDTSGVIIGMLIIIAIITIYKKIESTTK